MYKNTLLNWGYVLSRHSENVTMGAKGETKMNDLITSEQKRSSRLFNPTIGLAGFGVLLGWHFLILYFSFPMTSGIFPADFVYIRQVVLNASLCAFFGVFGFMMSGLPQRDDVRSHVIVYVAMGVGAVGSATLIVGSNVGIIWPIVAVVMIGASEAVLMLLWLRFYTETSENYSGASLGASALFGSLICFFSYHLTFEVSAFILVILPIASGLLLITMTKDIPLRKNDLIGSGVTDWSSARKPYWKTTSQLMAMALFFGMVQGCNSIEKTLLPAADPIAILGAALAGVVLFVIYLRSKHLPNLGVVINTSLMLFIAGMMILPFHVRFFPEIAAFLIMTGFIFYFILTLIFIVDLCRTFDLNTTVAVGMNQALEYGMFAVGILVGNLFWTRFADNPIFPFAISFIAIFVLAAITLFLTTERPPWEADFYKSKHVSDRKAAKEDENCADEAEEVEESDEVDALVVLSERYALTPREVEVFTLLSKGRNAEFIQNALVISNHTVKTHIYNIYRKMDIHSLQDLLDLMDAEEALQGKDRCGDLRQ